jgi:hypothetical protein
LITLRLAKAGYGGGDPERIAKMKVSTVLKLIQYEIFLKEYESKFMDLNRSAE